MTPTFEDDPRRSEDGADVAFDRTGAFQDGADFYSEETGKFLAHAPIRVRDFDTESAKWAREWFVSFWTNKD